MPKQINTYQVGQSLVKKFGLKGRFQPVLDEVIVPVVTVGETLPEDIRLAITGIDLAASGAGNQNLVTFRNGVNSGILIRLKKWWAVSGAPLTDFISIAVGTTTVTSGTGGFWRDRRLAGGAHGFPVGAQSPTTALVPPLYHLDTDHIVWVDEWVIGPGQLLTFRQNAVNTTLNLNLSWEETDLTATLGG